MPDIILSHEAKLVTFKLKTPDFLVFIYFYSMANPWQTSHELFSQSMIYILKKM